MKNWDNIISLIDVKYENVDVENENRPIIEQGIEIKTEVYAKVKNVSGSDFYKAKSEGLKDTLVFIVHSFEYNGEKKLEFNGKVYGFVRKYENDYGEVELTFSEVLGFG